MCCSEKDRRLPAVSGRRGMTLVELMFALAIIVTALLGFVWGLGVSVKEVGATKLSYAAHNAARNKIEEMKGQPFEDLYDLYGPYSSRNSFAVTYEDEGETYTLEGYGGGNAGVILLGTMEPMIMGDFGWVNTYDLNGDGDSTDWDTSADYEILPVIVRIQWQDSFGTRQLDVTSILMDPKYTGY